MIIRVYQSETDEYIEMESIGKIKYIGESFGALSLSDGILYDVVEVLKDDLVRIVDDSEEDYLYSMRNPAPLDGSSKGGKWELVEDYQGVLRAEFQKQGIKI
ncbi:hypothetical protein [Senegalia massiliensis]|uniref:Uncharacterized protein n=1 Tax=Senegalia massiliensis TaxID=1720316 RepID=A0A845R0W3_9CLOT|nr:hypothetical protein [Senegalia massiliensis]NBI08070.1 hypothetical protein [Senegalia massiliensis]